MTSLWKRVRAAYRRSEERRDELVEEKVLLEQERRQRERVEPETAIPQMRESTNWADWSSPL